MRNIFYLGIDLKGRGYGIRLILVDIIFVIFLLIYWDDLNGMKLD